MNEEQLNKRLEDIDSRLKKIEKMLEQGYVQNLFKYMQVLMNELSEIKSRI